jgi:toxin CcdB
VAQFTLYRNNNPRTQAISPLLVDVQTDLLEELQTRVVIPLTKAAALTQAPVSQLTPTIEFEGEVYVLLTPQLAGIARGDLGSAAGNLAARRDIILAALDFLLTGYR